MTAPSSSESDTPVVGKGEENDSSSRSGKSSKSSESDKPVDSKAETKPKPKTEAKSDKEKPKDPSGNEITELPHTGDSKAGTALFSSIGASLLAVALFLKRKLKS